MTTQLLKRIRDYLKWLIQTIGFLSGIITLLLFLGIGTTFVGYSSKIGNLILIGIVIVIFSLLFGITYYTVLQELTKARKNLIEENKTPPTPNEHHTPIKNFEILRKEIVYEYLPDGRSMYQRKHLKLRAMRNNLDHYEDRYRWTGSGKCELQSKTLGFVLANQRKEEEGIWDYFAVVFPRTLHKGDSVEFTVEWELYDDQAQAKNFLSAMIDCETKYLLLQVNLPNELAPTSAHFCEYENFIDKEPTHVVQLYWSPATKCLKYEVPNPIIYHQYSIRWYRE